MISCSLQHECSGSALEVSSVHAHYLIVTVSHIKQHVGGKAESLTLVHKLQTIQGITDLLGEVVWHGRDDCKAVQTRLVHILSEEQCKHAQLLRVI